MNTVRFPPLCPYGNADDSAALSASGSHYHVLPVTPDCSYFIRIFTDDARELSYTIEPKAATEAGLLGFVRDNGVPAAVTEEHVERLREWGFDQLVAVLKMPLPDAGSNGGAKLS